MQWQYIIMLILGVGFFLIGLKWTIFQISKKDIVRFSLKEKKIEFQINEVGVFSVFIVGGWFIDSSNGFKISIRNLDTSEEKYLPENKLKSNFWEKGKRSTEFTQFEIFEKGFYSIEIENNDKLIVKKSRLISKRVFQKKISTDLIEILIKESISSTNRMLSVLYLVLGGNMAVWGFIKIFFQEIIK